MAGLDFQILPGKSGRGEADLIGAQKKCRTRDGFTQSLLIYLPRLGSVLARDDNATPAQIRVDPYGAFRRALSELLLTRMARFWQGQLSLLWARSKR